MAVRLTLLLLARIYTVANSNTCTNDPGFCRTVNFTLKQLEDHCPKAQSEVEILLRNNGELHNMVNQKPWEECNPRTLTKLRKSSLKVHRLTQDLQEASRVLCERIKENRQEIMEISQDLERNFNLLPVALHGSWTYRNRTLQILQQLVPEQQTFRWDAEKLGRQGLWDAFWYHDRWLGSALVRGFAHKMVKWTVGTLLLGFLIAQVDKTLTRWLEKEDEMEGNNPILGRPRTPIWTASPSRRERPLSELDDSELRKEIRSLGWEWKDCDSRDELLERACASRAAPSEVCDWSSERVMNWLNKVGDDIATDYSDKFISNDVSGRTLLYIEESFDALGVETKLHQMRILSCRDKLLVHHSQQESTNAISPRNSRLSPRNVPLPADSDDESNGTDSDDHFHISGGLAGSATIKSPERPPLSPIHVPRPTEHPLPDLPLSPDCEPRSEPRSPLSPPKDMHSPSKEGRTPVSLRAMNSAPEPGTDTDGRFQRRRSRSVPPQPGADSPLDEEEQKVGEESDILSGTFQNQRRSSDPYGDVPLLGSQQLTEAQQQRCPCCKSILRYLVSPIVGALTSMWRTKGISLWIFLATIYFSYPEEGLLIGHCAPRLTDLARKTAAMVGSPKCTLRIRTVIDELDSVKSALDESVRYHKESTISKAFASLASEEQKIQQAINTGKLVQKGLQVATEWKRSFSKASTQLEARNTNGQYTEMIREYELAAEKFQQMISELHAFASVGESSIEIYSERLTDLQKDFKAHAFDVAVMKIKLIETTLSRLRDHSKNVQGHIDTFIDQMNKVRETVSTEIKSLGEKASNYKWHLVGGSIGLLGGGGALITAGNLANLALVGINPAATLGVTAVVAAIGTASTGYAEHQRKVAQLLKEKFNSFDNYLAEVQRRGIKVGTKVRKSDHLVFSAKGTMSELRDLAVTLNDRPVHIMISPAEQNMIDKRVKRSKTQLQDLHMLYKAIRESATNPRRIQSGTNPEPPDPLDSKPIEDDDSDLGNDRNEL